MGKTMEEHQICGSVLAYLTGEGTDPFGDKNMIRPWDKYKGMDLKNLKQHLSF